MKENIVVQPEYWGTATVEQIKDNESRVFLCGKCSNDEANVYHNLIGNHRHIPASELLPQIIERDRNTAA